VLALLEKLKDDPELYVRRSVANNLNDIGKDHPDLLAATARRWLRGASDERVWVIRHALRSAVKRGEKGALAALGFGGKPKAIVANAKLIPRRARVGDSVTLSFDLRNPSSKRERVLVDFRVHFAKARGKTGAKVFKLKQVTLAPRETVRLAKKISLKEMTTRKHYPGKHAVDVMLNGRAVLAGTFHVVM
jgi:hypothetical protein